MNDYKELRRLAYEGNLVGSIELIDRLEAAERDAAHQKAFADSALRVAEGWERKCHALRAKIDQMEKQEPVAWQRLYKDRSGSEDFTDSPDVFERQRPLYALPGAQGEGK